MPKIKLTARAIDKLRPAPSGRATLYWDSTLRGFGVLVSGKTGGKTFVLQRDLPGGRTRRVTVAAVNVLKLDKARERAEAVLADFYRGIDPKLGRRGAVTLKQTLADYLDARKSLRDTTRGEYRRAIEKHLAAWRDRPLREITPEMIETRHRTIAAESGAATANGVMRTFRLLWNFAAERVPDLGANPARRLKR